MKERSCIWASLFTCPGDLPGALLHTHVQFGTKSGLHIAIPMVQGPCNSGILFPIQTSARSGPSSAMEIRIWFCVVSLGGLCPTPIAPTIGSYTFIKGKRLSWNEFMPLHCCSAHQQSCSLSCLQIYELSPGRWLVSPFSIHRCLRRM